MGRHTQLLKRLRYLPS